MVLFSLFSTHLPHILCHVLKTLAVYVYAKLMKQIFFHRAFDRGVRWRYLSVVFLCPWLYMYIQHNIKKWCQGRPTSFFLFFVVLYLERFLLMNFVCPFSSDLSSWHISMIIKTSLNMLLLVNKDSGPLINWFKN